MAEEKPKTVKISIRHRGGERMGKRIINDIVAGQIVLSPGQQLDNVEMTEACADELREATRKGLGMVVVLGVKEGPHPSPEESTHQASREASARTSPMEPSTSSRPAEPVAASPPPKKSRAELESMTKDELHTLAEQQNIDVIASANKAELVDAIQRQGSRR